MKSFTWQAICIVGALAALVSFPRVSAAFDCSFGGVISPPLPEDLSDPGECIATGSIKANGDLVVDAASTTKFDVEGGMTLRIRKVAGSSGSLFIEEDGKMSSESDDVFDPVVIEAAGELHNAGILNITAASDSIRLRAVGDLTLHGTTNLDAAQVKLESVKGNITIDGATLTSRTNTLDIVAPHGTITVSNSTFSAGNGTSQCRFTVGGTFTDGGGNTFYLCASHPMRNL